MAGRMKKVFAVNAWMLRWMYDPESDATPFGGTKAVLLDEKGNVRASRQGPHETKFHTETELFLEMMREAKEATT